MCSEDVLGCPLCAVKCVRVSIVYSEDVLGCPLCIVKMC